MLRTVIYNDVLLPLTVAEWLQWLACPLQTGRHWLGLGSNPGDSVGGVPDHA